MITKTLILFLAFLLNSVLAFVVLANNPKQKLNQTFFMIAIGVAAWNFATFMFWQTEYVLFWARMMFVGPILIPSAFLCFSLSFPDKGDLLKLHQRMLIFSPWALFIPMSATDIIVKSVNFADREVTYGIGNSLFAIYFFSFVLVGFIILYRKYRTSVSISKTQLSYMFLGMAISTIIGTITNLVLPLIGTSKLNFIGPSATVIFVSLTAYAITRYRLMGIEFIIRKGLVYSLITAIMSVLYFIVIYLSEHYFRAITGYSSLWFTIPAIFILALLFEPMMNLLQSSIDRTFFRARYMAEKISRKFAEGVKKLRKIEDFAKFIANSAYRTLKLKGTSAYVFDESRGAFICLEAKGSLLGLKNSAISPDSPIVKMMSEKRSALLKDETKMPEENFYLCVPSLSSGKNGRLLGFLAADAKLNNTPFSVEEIELLEMLANQTASGIENALLYRQQIATIEKSLKLEKLASLGEATAGVAHEAKNALGYVSAFSQLLEKSVDKPDFLENASRAFPTEVGRIKVILQGIEDYSKQTEQNMENINVKQLVEKTIVLVRDQAKGKNVVIDSSVNDALHVTADKNRMIQVLLNLFMNAIEAMPNGGILSVSTEHSGQEISIKVTDSGTGIPRETLQKIFEPFFTTKKQGTGLGLAIVKRIIEENHGRLNVSSEVGKGTTFTLAFQS
ncbi:MAG: ATP-binding protein [Candidatus Margulisiibacteriota bacterium]